MWKVNVLKLPYSDKNVENRANYQFLRYVKYDFQRSVGYMCGVLGAVYSDDVPNLGLNMSSDEEEVLAV
jgi:hypothetical protein